MAAPVRTGEVLAGKYRVERVLGGGGMGVVVAARHLQLDQRVALKFLRRDQNEDPVTYERFLREARAIAQLRSEHVVRVFDVGELDDGSPYIVMECLTGEDLGAALEARGPMPVARATECVLQACVAIAEAHVRGIVHRDLKPRNLFLTRRPDGKPLIKVLDFGVSKLSSPWEPGQVLTTGSQVIIGTPSYMSPEQMRSSRDVDVRTDIWSLGVILYELISGRLPFPANTLADLCAQVTTGTPDLLSRVASSAPADLDEIVSRCLTKDPGQRYADVADLAAALAPLSTPYGRICAESIRGILRGDAPSVDTRSTERYRRSETETRRASRRWVAAVAGAAVVLTGLGVTLLWHPGKRPAAVVAPPVAAPVPRIQVTELPQPAAPIAAPPAPDAGAAAAPSTPTPIDTKPAAPTTPRRPPHKLPSAPATPPPTQAKPPYVAPGAD